MKPKPWKKISSNEVFLHPRIHLLEDTVELPNGERTTYIKHAPTNKFGVAVIAINDNDEILLQKEYSYPPNEIMWQLPGGGGNEGEDIIDAANRELSEESGLIGKQCEILGFYYPDNRRSDLKQYVVLCTDLEEKLTQGDPEEFIESHWVAISELKSLIRKGEFSNAYLLAALSIYFSTN